MSRGARLEGGVQGGGRVVAQASLRRWTAGRCCGVSEEEVIEKILGGGTDSRGGGEGELASPMGCPGIG